VSEIVRALLQRDPAVERWLREEVAAGHREYLADPSQAVPADAVLDRIKARRAAQQAP
jgi:antitoxin ParD1/3/4